MPPLKLVLAGLAGLVALAIASPGAASSRMLDAASTANPRGGGKLECRPARRRFRTLPRHRLGGWCVRTQPGAAFGPGHLLLTPRAKPSRRPEGPFGPVILSNTGKLLWSLPRRDQTHDLKVVRVRGRPLLAYFQRRRGGGFYQLLDDRYRPAGRIRTGNGYSTNMHELQLTDRGTAYLSSYPRAAVPGVGRVVDYVIQEVDIASGAVRFEWHALDHVPLAASYALPEDGEWDFFHGNAIEPPAGDHGTLLISSRNTSAVYGVDRGTGAVSWILGGKLDEFGLAPALRFCAQHDARWLPGGDLTLFDNGGTKLGGGCPVHPARVLQFRLDIARRRAELVGTLGSALVSSAAGGLFPGWVGSARRSPNGDTLVNWGNSKHVTEHGPGREPKLSLRLEHWTYRAVRARWVGRPLGRPAIVARRRPNGGVDVWASWNGATEIRRWRVLAGRAGETLHPAGTTPFRDLETRLRVGGRARHVAVEALDGQGGALGRSRTVSVLD